MSVSFGAVGPGSSGASSSASTTLAFSHTVGASDNVLIVGAIVAKSPDSGFSISGVTYGAASMTAVGSAVHSNAATGGFVQAFRLFNPTPGTATVTITVAGGTPTNILGGGQSYAATGGSITLGAQVSATGTSPGDLVVSVPGTTSGNMVYAVGCSGTQCSYVASGAATIRWQLGLNSTTGAGNAVGGDAPAGGSVSMDFNPTTDDDWALIAFEIQDAGAPASQPSVIPPQYQPHLRGRGRGRQGPFTPFQPWPETAESPSNDVAATAGVAASTLVAPNATSANTATAGAAASTAVATNPVPAITATAGVAVVGSVATAATVSTTGGTSAPAGVAAVSVTAVQPSTALTVNAGVAAVTAAATAATTTVKATAGVAVSQAVGLAAIAAATAAAAAARVQALAVSPAAAVTGNPGAAAVSSVATAATTQITVRPGVGIVGATAVQPTVSTSGNTNAFAGVASVSAAATTGQAAVSPAARVAVTLATASAPALQAAATAQAAVVLVAGLNIPPSHVAAKSTPSVTAAVTSASSATDPRDGAASVAGAVSAATVTDPRDGAASVTGALSVPTVT